MAQQTVDIGAAPDDGNGDPLRTAMTKINSNFTELYGTYITGTVANYSALPAAASSNGLIYWAIASEGVWPFTYKQKGLWRSNGTIWEHGGAAIPLHTEDSTWVLGDEGDNTKTVNFALEGGTTGTGTTIATSQTADRTITLDDKDGTVVTYDSNGLIDHTGTIDLTHTATENDDHAMELIVDAAGFGDVKALDIAYTTGALAATEEEGVILMNIDESSSTGGEVFGLEVLTTDLGSAKAIAVKTGVQVDAISQDSGSFVNAAKILVLAVDQTTALSSGGAGNVTCFSADNDTVTIGQSNKFAEIEILIDTGASGSGIGPTFEYSTGGSGFSAFVPTDGTNGMKNTGLILWDEADIPSWATNASGNYEIRITRTRNSLSTVPILDLIQVASVTLYSWDKDGIITGNTVEVTGDTSAGDAAAIGYTPVEGLILTGQGSTDDVTIKNDADATVLNIPTGTTGVNLAGTLTTGGNIDVSNNDIVNVNKLELDDGTNPAYEFFVDGTTGVHIKNTTSGQASQMHMTAQDEDGTDNVKFQIFGLGDNGAANNERLSLDWSSGSSVYQLKSLAAGTGTVRPLVLSTDGNTNQLYLKADGNIGIGNATAAEALDVTGNIAVSGTVDGRDLATDGTKLDGITGTNTGDEASATTTVEGIVELATAAEAAAGTDTGRTPSVSVLPALHQDSKYVFAADGEASDAYAITLTPAPAAYATGQVFHFTANTANTGAATLNVNSLGAKTIVKRGSSTLADNDIKAGQAVTVIYDGTNFQMQSQLGNAPSGSGDMVLADVQVVTGLKTFGTAGGAVGKFALAGSTSGSTVVDASATASGTITIPAATDTLVGKATTDTLTNKSIDADGTGNSITNIDVAEIKSTSGLLEGIIFFKDGNGTDTITTGAADTVLTATRSGTITGWYVNGDDTETGGITVDILKNGTSIVGAGTKPFISASNLRNSSTTLTSWTTTFVAGDRFKVSYSGITTFTSINVTLTYDIT